MAHGFVGYQINGTGNLIWQKCLGGVIMNRQQYSINSRWRVHPLPIGESKTGMLRVTTAIGDYWLVKLDNSGNMQWQKNVRALPLDEAWSVRITNDGGYIVAGMTGSYDGMLREASLRTEITIYGPKSRQCGKYSMKKCYGGTAKNRGTLFNLLQMEATL